MNKLRYLNVGCGSKYHRDWTNIDLYSDNPDVLACDLFNRLPFEDNRFDVIYLSQVLEHFTKKDAVLLLVECYRVLNVNGIIRIAVPDLENIVRNYIRLLEKNLSQPTATSIMDYEWIMIEMYDQTIRNVVGGEMLEVMCRENNVNEKFISERLGLSGKIFRDKYYQSIKITKREAFKNKLSKIIHLKYWGKILAFLKRRAIKILFILFGLREELKYLEMGTFRMGGEIHYWMYDRYSLSRTLSLCNFRDIKLQTAHDSDIPYWSKYELDVKNGEAYDPPALFIEARK